MMNGFTGKVCCKGLWDESVPGISFDQEGVSNYARIFERMLCDFPKGQKGESDWRKMVDWMKSKGKRNQYDCIIGVSGGTDSSYLLHVAAKEGLRPLAVYLDNGWGSHIVVSNIKKVTSALNIDLYTYVINYEEVVEVLRSYILAELPWVDSPTDLAIKAILYKTAAKHNVQAILIGHDFRTEGFQPNEWTYSDARQLKYLVRKFSKIQLKSYPVMPLSDFFFYSFIKGIKLIRPFFYIDYSKKEAKKFLKSTYQWEDYGGHHYENIFTKFIITYWMYEKFGIDKRKITFSAYVLSNEMSREEAIARIAEKPYDSEKIKDDIAFICKKLNFTIDEFEKILKSNNRKYFYDYPSYYPLLQRYQKLFFSAIKYFLPNKPLMFYLMEERKNA